MATKIINLTPHSLNIFREGKIVETIESSGLARAEEIDEPVLLDAFISDYNEDPSQFKIHGVPVVQKRFGHITGLPDPKQGTYYFVSRIILEACPNRNDLITSSKLVRDENGRILGCEEFSII